MGLGVGLLSLAVTTAGTVAQVVQGKKAQKAQREARAIQNANEEVKNKLARRRAAREQRKRRARLVSTAETAGATGSSGLVGATSALGTNFGAAVAEQRGNEIAARGVSAALQRSADAKSRGAAIGSFTTLVGKGLNFADDNDLFD